MLFTHHALYLYCLYGTDVIKQTCDVIMSYWASKWYNFQLLIICVWTALSKTNTVYKPSLPIFFLDG